MSAHHDTQATQTTKPNPSSWCCRHKGLVRATHCAVGRGLVSAAGTKVYCVLLSPHNHTQATQGNQATTPKPKEVVCRKATMEKINKQKGVTVCSASCAVALSASLPCYGNPQSSTAGSTVPWALGFNG